MTAKTQTVSIRLLHDGVQPGDSVRSGVTLTPWPTLEGAQIALGTLVGDAPKWSSFLGLSDPEKENLSNASALGLLFVPAAGRWFAISFGLGHVKLNPDAFEQDFGLRVVLNTVDPDKLRSADIRTPDDNTTSRRTQTARRSDQTAFSIDIERDIVRGLAGEPKDVTFATRVAGSDGLTLTKAMKVADLPQVCAAAFAASSKIDYQTNFAWVDQIKHVRDKATIKRLDAKLVDALTGALAGSIPDTLSLAYPVIYDPEKARHIRHKGFGSLNIHSDLDISGYVADMVEKGLTAIAPENLDGHKVRECNAEGRDDGDSWRVKQCLVFETDLDGEKYVLSADRWYLIAADLAKAVTDFFDAAIKATTFPMPAALVDENEETYNKRIAAAGHNMLCLDRKLVTPTNASSKIEVCDFLGDAGALIHVKDQTSSSRLSHLFNQGTVSARVLKMDGLARDLFIGQIAGQEAQFGVTGYQALVAPSGGPYDEGAHLVVYAVIHSAKGAGPHRLPFFSLVTFRQAATELRALGYKCAFAWINKPASTPVKAKRSPKAKGGAATAAAAPPAAGTPAPATPVSATPASATP